MKNTIATLGSYAEKCYPDRAPAPRPFNCGRAKDPPIVEKEQKHTILLFPGAFNPPHRSHAATLTHVFHNAGADLDVIAAIVLPGDPDRLEAKYARRPGRHMILSTVQRARLWGDYDGFLPEWCWVWDRSRDEFDRFRARLEGALRHDGFSVQFVIVCGPDYVTKTRLISLGVWGSREALVSDATRPADFTTATPGVLRPIDGFLQWEGVKVDKDWIEWRVEQKMRAGKCDIVMSPEQIAKEKAKLKAMVDSAHLSTQYARICRRAFGKQRTRIRFIPWAEEVRGHRASMSSTEIRNLINTADPAELAKGLSSSALSPDLLAKIVLANECKYMEGKALDPEEEEIRRAALAPPEVVW